MPASVPVQKRGAQSNTRKRIRFANTARAVHVFEQARAKLLDVNNWYRWAGGGARFQLVNEHGDEINSPVKRGNYFRIEIPGLPGIKAGEGYEWVRIEKIDEESTDDSAVFAIRVRPCSPPFIKHTEVAHFFAQDATSTFSVSRTRNIVTVSVLGRNEKPNTNTRSIWSWIRNVIVAFAAMLGFNKPQWSSLVRGVLEHAQNDPE